MTQIIDPTGTICTPGSPAQCLGNGEHYNADGTLIECCCDECDYMQDCWTNTTNDDLTKGE